MNATGTIVLKVNAQDKEYPFVFDMKARRLFMEKRNLEYFDDYTLAVQNITPKKGKSFSLTGLYVFMDLIITAIQSASGELPEIDEDQIADQFYNDPSKLMQIMSALNQAQEKETKEDSSSQGKSKGKKVRK